MSLIVLEGIDFCGKSTQVKMLKEALEGLGHTVETSEEPTKTLPTGIYIREYASSCSPDKRAPRISEALLFYADRFEHIQKKILPAMKARRVVILDRYWYSTYAYQVSLMGSDSVTEFELPAIIESLNKYVVPPDIAFYIDITVGEAKARAEEAGRRLTIFERNLEPVRFNYMTLCDTHKLIRIDGNLDPEEVHEEILRQVLLSGVLRVF